MQEEKVLINLPHSILIYSVFGLGKTTLFAELAEQLIPPSSGMKVRLVTAEHTNSIQEKVDSGLVEVWKVNTRNYPFETLRFAADGYWPVDPRDPESPLVAPTSETWEKYPIRVFEGLSTLSGYIAGSTVIGGLANRIGEGEKIGPTDSGELIRIQDGQTGVGSPSRSNYGFIQREMEGIVRRSQKRPGYIIWTSHEDEVKEKKGGVSTGRTVSGPEVFGGALTTVIGREFADVWHIVGVDNLVQYEDGREGVITDRKLFVKPHVKDGVVCLAKNSASKKRQGEVPECLAMTKDGLPLMDVGSRIIEKVWGRKKEGK